MTTAKKTIAKRIRWLWWGKWSGVTLCVLLFALWLASGWYRIAIVRAEPGPPVGKRPTAYADDPRLVTRCSLAANWGRVYISWWPKSQAPDIDMAWKFQCVDNRGGLFPTSSPKWAWSMHVGRNLITLPLWLPFLLIALPTGFLFWSDHRRRMRGGAGFCPMCGYSLTGNTSGKCPECGAETPVARAAT